MQTLQKGLIFTLLFTASLLNAQISVSIQVNQSIACYGNNTGSLTAMVTPAGIPYTYSWSNSGNTATISDLVAGTYTITVQGPSGGTATATAILSEPTELILTALTELPLAVNPTGTVEVETIGGTEPYSFLWINSASLPVSNQEDLVDATANIYTLTATDGNGCTTELTPVQLVTTSGTTDALGIDLKIFPNPVADNLTIELPEARDIQMQVFNAGGQIIETQMLQGPRSSISVESWPPGYYSLVFPGTGKTLMVVKI